MGPYLSHKIIDYLELILPLYSGSNLIFLYLVNQEFINYIDILTFILSVLNYLLPTEYANKIFFNV